MGPNTCGAIRRFARGYQSKQSRRGMIPRQSLSINAFTSASFPRKRESMLLLTGPVTKVLDSRVHGGVAPPACGKDTVLMVRDRDVNRRDADANRRDADFNRRDADANRRDADANRRDADANRRDADANRRDADANRRDADFNRRDADVNRRVVELNEWFVGQCMLCA